jgi:3-hydroxy-9,10-secoandrosta-1,3,5(10)-triene-9,17-dione monooxygenase reductase component
VSIHSTDPFATPEHLRSPVRRLRGRLPAAVTLWTANHPTGRPAGLSVSSTLVVDGDPGRLLGLLDEESELWTAIEASGRFAVQTLQPGDEQLADRFAGLMPAPGGLFGSGADWWDTGYGPVPAGRDAWVGCRLDGARPVGWSLLIEATIERIESGTLDGAVAPVIYYRGRFHTLC